MEDSPGHVTGEVEEKFQELQQEARKIRAEISMMTGKLVDASGDDQEVDFDGAIIDDKKHSIDDIDENDGYDDEIFDVTFDKTIPNSAEEGVVNEASPSLTSDAVATVAPTIESPVVGQKLWFLREKQPSSSIIASTDDTEDDSNHPLIIEKERSARFVGVVGRTYGEELGHLTSNIARSTDNSFRTSNISSDDNEGDKLMASITVSKVSKETQKHSNVDVIQGTEDKPVSSKFDAPVVASAPKVDHVVISPAKPIPVAVTVPQSEDNEYGNDDFDDYEDNSFEVDDDE
jgi:hypothetical protein